MHQKETFSVSVFQRSVFQIERILLRSIDEARKRFATHSITTSSSASRRGLFQNFLRRQTPSKGIEGCKLHAHDKGDDEGKAGLPRRDAGVRETGARTHASTLCAPRLSRGQETWAQMAIDTSPHAPRREPMRRDSPLLSRIH